MPVTKKQKVGVSFSSNTREHDDNKVNNKKLENKLQFEKTTTTTTTATSTKLHQCSFSGWLPKSISSISYNNEKNLVAVGREDSSIDVFIRDGQELVLLKTLGGSKFDFPIISTVWLKLSNEKLVLLSIMENKFVMWDIDSYTIIQELNTIGTVKDTSYNHNLNLLAVCTTDSIVRIYNFDGEKIDYQSSFPTITDSKSNVIEWGIDQKTIIVGCTNQLVLFKVDSLRSVLNVTTDNIISLKPLSDNTVVCGFINGFVSIFDIGFGSIIQDFRNLHAPVRAIQVSKNFQQFYASGDESIVVSYNKSGDKWAPSGQHRRDSHDIKCLEITDKYLISGGNSTQIIFYDLQNFTSLKNNNNYQRFKSYPSSNTISITNNKTLPILLVEASRHQINLWSLGDSKEQQDSLDLPNGTPLAITDKTKKLLQLESKVKY
ncbi:hypothetical protein DICPUDRAFT_89722 [Dictyostelium purpureum]|uniref:Anaphase-promoting complex subunit 4 WD40 domain-containing protein n=1 Tax=Dictyostelium purpureum TaxID=5786 RepID=F0ZXR5_DICPU|nr:uncharacterized protein DICPUDRAFT_89722 [Dictyostelium purpureum]EGC31258.1 hypothetical protein DICPUDRAFT_89722 [Dictyostelium purpureum]|eukprot:XP_003292203.1 hypothetical protein DICPUDRAFT_89722 [Dictyostelium purpureum]